MLPNWSVLYCAWLVRALEEFLTPIFPPGLKPSTIAEFAARLKPCPFQNRDLIYAGGRWGMRGSMGARLPALIPVELRIVEIWVSRPGSLSCRTHSSPRCVPRVWAVMSGLGFCVISLLLAGTPSRRRFSRRAG